MSIFLSYALLQIAADKTCASCNGVIDQLPAFII